ncbi:MAG: Fe-Mn family superoxide dismutase [Nanoarchaeota archaeon]
MEHMARDFSNLLGLQGFSDRQLQAHFALYQGYVKKLNEIEQKLRSADRSAPNYSFNEYSELKRRHVVAFNGAYLHELYFENMTKEKTGPSDELKKAAEASFGSWDNMINDMKAAAGSTPGWVLITYNKVDKQLHTWIMFEHHIGLPAHQEIVLALDCWEHAFMIDYGIDKASYLKAFLDVTDWKIASERFRKAKK